MEKTKKLRKAAKTAAAAMAVAGFGVAVVAMLWLILWMASDMGALM